jgi:hypothetical protein
MAPPHLPGCMAWHQMPSGSGAHQLGQELLQPAHVRQGHLGCAVCRIEELTDSAACRWPVNAIASGVPNRWLTCSPVAFGLAERRGQVLHPHQACAAVLGLAAAAICWRSSRWTMMAVVQAWLPAAAVAALAPAVKPAAARQAVVYVRAYSAARVAAQMRGAAPAAPVACRYAHWALPSGRLGRCWPAGWLLTAAQHRAW